jgi:hypothetical protein
MAAYAAAQKSLTSGTGSGDVAIRWVSRMPVRAPRAVHDPGKIVADLAAAVALGGDCLANIAVLRPSARGSVHPEPVPAGLPTLF